MHSEYRITDQRATASWQSHLPLKDLKEQWLPRRSSESLKLTLCQTQLSRNPVDIIHAAWMPPSWANGRSSFTVGTDVLVEQKKLVRSGTCS